MVKKLLKYEFSSYAKTILPMKLILLGIALITRIIEIFEGDSKTFTALIWSSSIMLGIAMVVCIVMTIVVCTVRFYKNIYTAEGYLTLTLPVTHKAHIISKLITAVCAFFISLVSVILAFAVATAGEVFNETVKAAVYIVKSIWRAAGVHMVFYFLEVLVCAVVFIASVYLLFYACITVGQMAKKNRILSAFGVYFGYYVFRQIVGTVIIIVFVNCRDYLPIDEIINWIARNPKTFFHLLFCGIIVIVAIFSIIYFVITEKLMKNYLNIE